MTKIRDLGINVLPEMMRPPEIGGIWDCPTTGCPPGTLMDVTQALTHEAIELLKQQLRR